MGTEGVLRLDRPHGIAVVLLALILVLLCGRAALAEAGTSPPARITVVDDAAYAPFAFLDANDQPAGITIDLWQLWSRKTGIAVDFQLMQWEAVLEAVRSGRADAVGGLFATEERQRLFAFSQPFFSLTTSLFFHKQILSLIHI